MGQLHALSPDFSFYPGLLSGLPHFPPAPTWDLHRLLSSRINLLLHGLPTSHNGYLLQCHGVPPPHHPPAVVFCLSCFSHFSSLLSLSGIFFPFLKDISHRHPKVAAGHIGVLKQGCWSHLELAVSCTSPQRAALQSSKDTCIQYKELVIFLQKSGITL